MRIAKIIVDSAHLDNYKAALKEGIETALNTEGGVWEMSAVQHKDNPSHITVFEVYANEEAYQSHLQTPHFKWYKALTQEMVQSLELVDVVPIALVSKNNFII